MGSKKEIPEAQRFTVMTPNEWLPVWDRVITSTPPASARSGARRGSGRWQQVTTREDDQMTDAELNPPPNVLLSGVVGSTAYGLANADSDIDRIGTYAAPTSAFHGLHAPPETWVHSNPDATFHEAGKLARLLLKGNPTVTEICWLDAYETVTPEGEALIAIRSSFLSAHAIKGAYLGYAAQQFKRLENRGDGSFSADTRKRTAKHARHLRRLLCQGSGLHQTGHLRVRLSPNAAMACHAFGERVAAGNLDLAKGVLADAEDVFAGPGVLPDRPDEAAAEAWLQDVRRAYWEQP